MVSPTTDQGLSTGEGLDWRELGQGNRRGWSRRRCPGQAGPGGLGVAVPPLQEFPPVGVIGNRLGAGQGCSDGDPHTASVGPAPQGLSAGKTSPNTPVVWGGQDKAPRNILCAPHA